MIPTSWADDFFSPPQLDPQPPPWIQDGQEKPQAQPTPSAQPQAPTGPPPGFWGEEEQEESTPSRFSGSSNSNAKPKDSFKLTEPWNDILGDDVEARNCLGWGHPFLGVTMFQKQNSCDFMLSQKIEESKQQIRSLEDHTRSLVLKQVIKGKIKRVESKKFQLKYDLVMDVLFAAQEEGCRCLN